MVLEGILFIFFLKKRPLSGKIKSAVTAPKEADDDRRMKREDVRDFFPLTNGH